MFSFTVDVLTADNFNFSGGCIKLRSWLHLQRLLILGPVWLVLAGAGPSARLRQFALLLAKGILSVFVSVDAIVHLAVGGRTRPNSVLVVSLVVVSVHLDAHGVLLRLIEELAGHVVALCGRQWSICLMQINCVVVSRPWSEASLATTSDWVACFSFLTRYGALLREEIHVSTLWNLKGSRKLTRLLRRDEMFFWCMQTVACSFLTGKGLLRSSLPKTCYADCFSTWFVFGLRTLSCFSLVLISTAKSINLCIARSFELTRSKDCLLPIYLTLILL